MTRSKQGFTLIEMMLVLMIIGVLMLMLKNTFFPKNRDILYAQSCSNNIYGDINNFLNAAITSKSLYTGGQKQFPDIYKINFDTTNNKIILGYEKDQTDYIYQIIDFSGSYARSIFCQNETYQVELSGNFDTIEISKGLQNNQKSETFKIIQSSNKLFTGEMNLYMCNLTNPAYCSHFASYIIDSRTRNIINAKCLSFTGINDTECLQRNQ